MYILRLFIHFLCYYNILFHYCLALHFIFFVSFVNLFSPVSSLISCYQYLSTILSRRPFVCACRISLSFNLRLLHFFWSPHPVLAPSFYPSFLPLALLPFVPIVSLSPSHTSGSTFSLVGSILRPQLSGILFLDSLSYGGRMETINQTKGEGQGGGRGIKNEETGTTH